MRSPVAELLAVLAAAFEQLGLQWYLFGAQAALLYGASRLTADVDVTVRLPDDSGFDRLAPALQEAGFALRIDDPAFVARTRVLPIVHPPTAIPVDVVLAGPGLEERFLARARSVELEDVTIRVASPEDLIVMKVLAARPKDIEDVRAIAAARLSSLDTAYVRDTLKELEQALAQSDLVPAFEAVLQGARRIRRTSRQ